ncbi:MAG: glycosyltransferase [Candidatus Paceibacterota bacterium]|jgi:cellulose synthase/poly-beta-1,6-N-acetylglucosamine synthase-like glycosyltransferase
MDSFLQIVLYVFIFFSLYVQVFFLVTFFEKRRKLKIANNNVVILHYPTIGIIVPCWDEEKTIVSSIESILSVDYPIDKLKIYIVDDGSKDNTWQILQTFIDHPQIKVYHKENGGKYTAMNFALEYVDTELVISVDADTVLEKNALVEMVKFFQENPNVSAVGGTILIGNPKAISQKAQSIEYQMFSYNKKMLGLMGGVLVAPGAFSVYKTKILKKVGGWQHGHLLEDLELTFRIQQHGYTVDHCHTAVAYTKGPETFKKLWKQRIRWGTGFLHNTKKYKNMIFNKKFGNFGMFTIPMSLFAYLALVFVFFYSWYRIILMLIEKIQSAQIVGWSHLFSGEFSWNWFFIDTKTASFLSIILFGSIIMAILLGRKLSGAKESLFYILWYFLIYSFTQPLWIIRSIYSTIVSKKETWR